MSNSAPFVTGNSELSLTRGRIAFAFCVSIASDAFSFFVSPIVWLEPLVIGVDVVTGFLIWLALGRPLLLLPVLIAEATPFVGMFPLWTIVVGVIATTGRLPSRVGNPRQSTPPIQTQQSVQIKNKDQAQ